MKRFLLLFLLIIGQVGCSQKKEIPITELSQKDIDKGILVDVRTPEEYNMGHLDSAMNINWFDEDFAKQFESIDKNKTLYLYCKMGGRSAKASELLESKGYKTVNLLGGYDAWKEN
ncbi:rhodanese-related sulfurtransferase [Saonia flava]|uniref:Rhodanese-related sulfurtransferase n=1 Tax=Saonia flava TaxID=523696 RepID=A0A846R309_9FLAO|nr:rhodanese-like domain-containing protein [Saonia flava]NJB72783.1 rhodanese-related sulfurtransferase [Saonia flava]